MKKIPYIALAFAALCTLASCSDEPKEKDNPENDTPENDVTQKLGDLFVLTQGNFYNGIEGGLNVINLENNTIKTNVFKAANNASLGDTPQCGVCYGSKIYVGTYQSNTIEIIDRDSYLTYKQIKLSDETGNNPYSMVAYDGKVFISMYDGHLARLDTLSMAIDKKVTVGPNPDQIALHNNKIYVPISDGMNYPNYGKTACVVDPATMTVEKTFEVGLNPAQFFSTNNHLFLLCKGNYYDVASTLYEVNSDYSLTEVCPATLAAPYGDKVAIVNEPFTEGEPVVEYKLFHTSGDAAGTLADWNIERPDYANQIYYDEANQLIFLASYVMNGQYPSYDLPGYVVMYSDQPKAAARFELGSAGPACMFKHIK